MPHQFAVLIFMVPFLVLMIFCGPLMGLIFMYILLIRLMGKNIVKGATQVNGHSLKLNFDMFERLQVKHNNLNCHNFFWNIFH
jgi:hypothetical protein